MRVQRVSSVAKQYDQPKETEGGGECSLVGLCGLKMCSKCVANSIKGKIHRVRRGIPLQRNTTSPNGQGEGGNATWRGCVGYKCRRHVDGLQRSERRTVRNLEFVDGNCQRDTRLARRGRGHLRAPGARGSSASYTREQQSTHAEERARAGAGGGAAWRVSWTLKDGGCSISIFGLGGREHLRAPGASGSSAARTQDQQSTHVAEHARTGAGRGCSLAGLGEPGPDFGVGPFRELRGPGARRGARRRPAVSGEARRLLVALA